jgi:release factor glutamine methyltransferase
MTLRQALDIAKEKLSGCAEVDDPAFESEVLLRYALQISRAQLFLDLDQEISTEKEKLFQEWVTRRSLGEPVAYIIGCREFFGLDFYVDQRVLIPRPETELLVEEAIRCSRNIFKKISASNKITIADIGTGSGAVAVSLAVNLPQFQIYATDISASALEVAAINVRKHNVAGQVTLLQGDLLEPLPGPVEILVANLPYVTTNDLARMPSAKFEPALALDGGQNGLDQVFRLCRQLKGKLRPHGCVFLEIGLGQDRAVIKLLQDLFPSSEIQPLKDLAGINRAIKLTIDR